jgi:hypothetical protein
MHSSFEQIRRSVFFLALFTLIPLWNIPHTIAGRYVCEAILLIVIISYKPDWKLFFGKNKILLIFFLYLFFQLLFFSENFRTALSNFRGEWMHFILFSIIGSGVGLILGKMSPTKILLYLGIAFSLPLCIHLILFLIKGIQTETIPWRYIGINEIHGDLGYTALEAAILLFTFYLYQAKNKTARYSAIGLTLICILSPLLAGSRGGTGFTALSLMLIAVFHFFIGPEKKMGIRNKLLTGCAIAVSVLTIWMAGAAIDPNRWGANTISRLSTGLEGNPSEVYCNGIASLEDGLKQNGVKITPEIQAGVNSVVDGDGARVMAARSGVMLMLQHPMGIDQSKQAYQIAIRQYCNDEPKIFISHTHNAWIDTALAIGIPGIVLLFLVMLQYAKLGYAACIKKTTNSPFGVALLASAVLWTLRGILDSTLRDQMLEMQAFILSLLLGVLLAQKTILRDKKVPVARVTKG